MKQIVERSLPPKNATPKTYRDFLQSISDDRSYFERGLGYSSWLTGCALERAKRSSKVKRGEYQKVVEAVGLSTSTAYNCRRIYKAFTKTNALKMGYTEMLRALGWSSLDGNSDLETAGSSNGGGGGLGSGFRERTITLESLNPTLEDIASTFRAIKSMGLSTLEPEEAIIEYEVARTTLTRIKADCERSIRLVEQRLSKMNKTRRPALRVAS